MCNALVIRPPSASVLETPMSTKADHDAMLVGCQRVGAGPR